MFMLIFFIAFGWGQTTGDEGKKWCDQDNYGDIAWMYPADLPDVVKGEYRQCIYKVEYSDYYHGFYINQEDPSVDIFEVYLDCCGPHSDERDTTRNLLTINDTKSNQPKKINFIFTAEEWKRAYHNITIINNAVNAPWSINTNNMRPNNSFILAGSRSYEEAKKNPYRIEASTTVFNITTKKDKEGDPNFREVVYLNFTWGYSPFVNVSGHLDIHLTDEVDRADCQYRFTLVGEEGSNGVDIKEEVIGNENVVAKVICQKGIYRRVAVCSKLFIFENEGYTDCGCSYQDYEYQNRAIDCTYINEQLDFQPAPVQDIIPTETEWGGFQTSTDTELNIPKGSHLTIVGDVVLPQNNMLITGDMVFKGSIIVNKTDVLYDLGSFIAFQPIDVSNIPSDIDAVFFIGTCDNDNEDKRIVNETYPTCDELLTQSSLKLTTCGGLKGRFIRGSSDIDCKCIQGEGSSFIQSDCDLFSTFQQYKYDVTFNGDYDGGKDTKRFWNSIKFDGTNLDVKYTSLETIVTEECDFRNVHTLTIVGNLRCKKVIVGADTTIIGSEGSVMSTYDIEIIGDITREVNQDALFRFGKGKFITDGSMTMNIQGTISKCFELVTMADDFSEDLTTPVGPDENNSNKYQLYSLGKLLRICPFDYELTQEESEVVCKPSDAYFKNFDYEHCPCSGPYCKYYLDDMGDNDIILQDNLDATLFIGKSISIYTEIPTDVELEKVKITSINVEGENDLTIRFIGDFVVGMQQFHSKTTIEIDGNIEFNDYPQQSQMTITSFKENAEITFSKNEHIAVAISSHTRTKVQMTSGVGIATKGAFSNDGYILSDGSASCYIMNFRGSNLECLYNLKNPNDDTTATSCSIAHCNVCSDDSTCSICQNGYELSSNQCQQKTVANCLQFSGPECVSCKSGYYLEAQECKQCPEDKYCLECSDANTCTLCKDNYILDAGICNAAGSAGYEKYKKVVGNRVIECADKYYLSGQECKECPANCVKCEGDKCLACADDYVMQGTDCVLLSTSNCRELINGTNKCGKCKPGFYHRENCIPCGNECKHCLENRRCQICTSENMSLDKSGENCIPLEGNDKKLSVKMADEEHPQGTDATISDITEDVIRLTSFYCKNYTKGLCLRCSSNYYAVNGFCQKCPDTCSSCFLESIDKNDATEEDGVDHIQCTSCTKNTDTLNNDNQCVPATGDNVCLKSMSGGLGCALCKDGYYRDGKVCVQCPESMTTCSSKDNALSCEEQYYLQKETTKDSEGKTIEKTTCKLRSSLENCKKDGPNGCTECFEGYHVENSQCKKCVDRCIDCQSETVCRRCSSEFIIKDGKCEHYKSVENCISADGIKCTECASGYDLKGGECDKESLWYVYVIVVIVVLLIIVVIVVIIAYVIMKRNMKLKQDDIQKIKHMNVDLKYSHDFVISDHDKFVFFEDNVLKVNETTKFEQVIGNVGKNRIKIQPTLMTSEKYDFTVEPSLVVLGHGKCVTFKFTITPYCSTHIEETIMYNILMFKTDQESTFEVKVDADTNVTNILDYDELITDKKVGEGSFGIVYKGKFRGNKVAIKMLKAESAMEEQLEEFNKEVSMLDKFRSDYIVHFFGAVFIPNRICMVTEFAKFGSLQHLIQKEQGKRIPKEAVRIKICMDGIRGMMYLHQNGILHRDIKPDNLLIFSLEKDIPVFAKLTDFGSSRNINLMMTNMTFTKGIGTPAYMAPEVLDQARYKTAADVFSLAITLFETMKWGPAYPKETFKYPWDIATYVSQGKRPVKPKKMRQQIFDIICRSWCHDPSERLRIEDLCEQFGKFNVNYK